ncbi:YwqJ-related putative deaminase [Streptomyces sp. SL13]|uniref:YwqJ-related putative deaminase n=1 Tax=Streptantibioticus silvisoli TaxID=2705255 RepID=A0AA90H8Z8_9ACTN|nr:YwqJ-related putative deaminase [Streptantibioticus silvisoli]MDI5967418.1 YwqJ-related putative deaminase [Streptantibioticus silvisoli]MDI5974106.1 YwqJ-related putative deaminase [Streptantibioticus silvisoli]
MTYTAAEPDGGAAYTPAPGGAPVLLRRRDGIMPAVAGALSVRGETLTCTGSKADAAPELHPLVAGFLAALPVGRRARGTGRCPEALLLSRYLTATDGARRGRAARKPLSHSDARRALKHAVITTRRIREDGDPAHDRYAAPCAACADLLHHFGVTTVEPAPEQP